MPLCAELFWRNIYISLIQDFPLNVSKESMNLTLSVSQFTIFWLCKIAMASVVRKLIQFTHNILGGLIKYRDDCIGVSFVPWVSHIVAALSYNVIRCHNNYIPQYPQKCHYHLPINSFSGTCPQTTLAWWCQCVLSRSSLFVQYEDIPWCKWLNIVAGPRQRINIVSLEGADITTIIKYYFWFSDKLSIGKATI